MKKVIIVLVVIFTTLFAEAQNRISGRVVDENGQALSGVNIYLKSQGLGTSTDSYGKFTIVVNKNDILVAAFIGYSDKEIIIDVQSEINFQLVPFIQDLEEIVVTGVSDPRTRLQASTSISIMKTKDIERVAATSAIDLLKNLPGIFVDAASGETRNSISTRGLTNFPLSNAYNFLSIQEDGLPISNMNFAIDNYLRADVTTARVEAIRGGSSTITSANAPGGIFNFISKSGDTSFVGEARLKLGLEGDGKNPYYRADLGIGGPLSKDKSLKYYVGGFLRYSQGARYPGYLMNDGGQLKANITKTYAKGEIKLYVKYLDDHNAFTTSTPTQNWSEQNIAEGFSYTDSYDIPSIQAKISRNGSIVDYDSRNKVYANEKAIGINWSHKLGRNLTINLASRVSDRFYNQQGSTFIAPINPTTPLFYVLPSLGKRYGTYTFTDMVTGQVLGTIDRLPGATPSPASDKITVGANNKFPGINNQVLFMPSFMSERSLSDFSNNMSINKKFDKMRFTVGAYFAKSEMDAIGVNTGNASGAATIEHQPHMIDIKLKSIDGKNYQVTSPEGFMKLDGSGQNTSLAKQNQYSLYFAHDWSLTNKFSLAWGVRYENVRNHGWNATAVPINTADDPKFGGIDNNPLTLYDNAGGLNGPELNYSKFAKYLSYSLSVNYKISENQALYTRISYGGKSADINTMVSLLTTPFNIENTKENDLIQKIQQYEVGYKYVSPKLRLFITPFLTKLGSVANISYFRNIDNTTYAPPVQFNTFNTKGVELEGDINFTDNIGLKISSVFQSSIATKYTAWIANSNGPADDKLLDFSGNKSGGVPPIMFNIAPRYSTDKSYVIFSYNYLSSRPANVPNGFEMRGYGNLDFTFGYNVSDNFTLQFNVNNLSNNFGVTNWLGSGGFPTSLNRDRITPEYVKANPNDAFSALFTMPRAYFLTGSFKF